MNTITLDTLKAAEQVVILRQLELQKDGWTPSRTQALSSERFARLRFSNGVAHEVVLPLARIAAWASLCDYPECAVEFLDDGRTLQLNSGPSRIRLHSRPDLFEDAPNEARPALVEFIARNPNTPYSLGGSSGDDKARLTQLRAQAARIRHEKQLKLARSRERSALRNLRCAVHEYLHELGRMEAEGYPAALANAKRFREARRYVRNVLRLLPARPDWLLTQRPPPEKADWIAGGEYQEASEAERFDAALARLDAAQEHRAKFKPRKTGSRHAGEEIEKRDAAVAVANRDLEHVVRTALRRRVVELYGESRADAADSFLSRHTAYAGLRRWVRRWPARKVELSLIYRQAVAARKALAAKCRK